jgi:hypothetical protein
LILVFLGGASLLQTAEQWQVVCAGIVHDVDKGEQRGQNLTLRAAAPAIPLPVIQRFPQSVIGPLGVDSGGLDGGVAQMLGRSVQAVALTEQSGPGVMA